MPSRPRERCWSAMIRGHLTALSPDRCDADSLEVGDVARDKREPVDHRRRREQGVAFGAWIGNLELRATLRDDRVDRENAIVETRENLIVDPATRPFGRSVARQALSPKSRSPTERSLLPGSLRPKQRHYGPPCSAV